MRPVDHVRAAYFGRRIVAIRRERGLIQADLARAAGISRSSLCDFELGRSLPSADLLEQLADALGLTMDELWKGTGRCARYGKPKRRKS